MAAGEIFGARRLPRLLLFHADEGRRLLAHRIALRHFDVARLETLEVRLEVVLVAAVAGVAKILRPLRPIKE